MFIGNCEFFSPLYVWDWIFLGECLEVNTQTIYSKYLLIRCLFVF